MATIDAWCGPMVIRMRIAHVTATFPPYRGGTGNVCFYNARELVRRGHEVHVFTAAGPNAPREEVLKGIQVHRLRPWVQVGNAPVLPQLVWHLRGLDVIHLHYPFFGGEVTPLAARLEGTPLVITYHQDVHLQGVMGALAEGMTKTLGRWTLRSARRLLFTSSDYGAVSSVRPLLRGREAIIDALPNGVDVHRFTPGEASPALRQQYGLKPEERVVLLVAALDSAHYFKGVPVLLEALARLPEQVKGVFVGDGDLRAAYVERAHALGLANRVFFPGRVSEDSLVDHYRLADVTVLPSTTMGEAFGLVLLESLACGTPVIASNLPGVRTVVAEGVDGWLVAPGDVDALIHALQRMFDMPVPQRRAMGEAGRRKVEEKYAWERIGEQLECIYFDIIGSLPRESTLHPLEGI